MNRLYVALGALLVILGLSYTVLHLYAGKAVASVKADIATKVIQSAVVESKASVMSDYRAQADRSTTLDTARPFLAIARKVNVQARIPVAPVKTLVSDGSTPEPVDPWVSVFNDAVRASNGAIESSGHLPRAL